MLMKKGKNVNRATTADSHCIVVS